MWQQIRNNPRAAVLAVLAHVIFVAVLLVSFAFSDDEAQGDKGSKLEVIKAEAVDEKQINAKLKRHRDTEKHQQQKIKNQARKKKEAQLREKKRKVEKKKKQAVEKKRLAEKKRKADLKKKKKKREEKLAKEKKRKEIERKHIEEQERKNQQELARQEAEMKQKLAADRQRQNAAQEAANQREISKYLGLIKNAVTRYWILPSQDVSGLSCDVKVRIIPNGEVIDVQIIKSSGNLAFDRSVETAVYRAAPLPVPGIESGLFDEFREVIFSFEPRGL